MAGVIRGLRSRRTASPRNALSMKTSVWFNIRASFYPEKASAGGCLTTSPKGFDGTRAFLQSSTQ